MSAFGQQRRLGRLLGETLPFLVPMDHGLSSGPIDGLSTPSAVRRTARQLHGLTSGIVVHRGMVDRLDPAACPPLVLQTMGIPATDTANARVAIAGLDEALRLDADAISVQIDFAGPALPATIAEVGRLVGEAKSVGMPVLCMVSGHEWKSVQSLLSAIRWATELGADLVKVDAGQLATGEAIDVSGAETPVLMAGGGVAGSLLQATEWAGASGFRGLCVGRGVFAAPDPTLAVPKLSESFMRGASDRDAT